MQHTLRQKAEFRGIGLHSGKMLCLELFPAPVGHGITFVRSDLNAHDEIRACAEHVVDTRLATTLGVGEGSTRVTIGTVEHILSALYGLGIDNVRIHVDGPEIPVADGSAVRLVEMLEAAGSIAQNRPRKHLLIKRDVRVEEEGKFAQFSPGNGFNIDCSLDFDHPLIPPSPISFHCTPSAYKRDIAKARTFGFLHDVEQLQRMGLALGGSLDNAIVIDGYKVLNPEGLRFPDEFLRHKVLDAIGDLSLLGGRISGRVTLHRSGHALNSKLVNAVLSNPRNYEWVEGQAEALPDAARDEAWSAATLEPSLAS